VPIKLFQPVNFVKKLIQPDIEIVKIEITQAIQCLDNPTCPDNSVQLYSGKPTMVRVYVRLASGPFASLSNIGGFICLGDRGEAGCGKLAVPSIGINSGNKVTVRKGASVSGGRGDLTATINFLLPPSWVKDPGLDLGFSSLGKPLEFTVYVNYMLRDYPYETRYDNNYQAYKFNIFVSQPVAILFVPVTSNGTKAAAGELWPIIDWMRLSYPTSNFAISLAASPFNWNTDWGGGCGGWMGLMWNLLATRGFDSRIWYGMVDIGASTPQTKASGCGMNPISVAGGFVGTGNRFPAEIAAQEVGHTLRREHAPGCSAGNPDPGYPRPNGLIDEYGLDVFRQQIYPPESSYDYMGYCGNENDTWTSRYTYYGLQKYFPAGYGSLPSSHRLAAPGPQAASQPFLVGMGMVSHADVTLVKGFYVAESSRPFPVEPGPYTVDLLDASGVLLYSQPFMPFENSNDDHEHADEGAFMLSLPWQENARTIQFKYQGQLIGTFTASPGAPTVSITSSGPQQWPDAGTVTIAWQAADPDGGALKSHVEYSSDGGTTWSTLAEGLDGNSLDVDTASLPGSDSALLRVRVSDGFNTATALSVPFRVGNKSPLVHISWPQDGAQLVAGTPSYFLALGLDPEDGTLNPDSIQWTSSRDGSLGSGDLLLDSLSVGEHIISITGVDSQGAPGTAQVRINVLPAESASESEALLDPFTALVVDLLLLALGIIALGLLLLIGGMLFWGRKRK
jgi:hypothetical protein